MDKTGHYGAVLLTYAPLGATLGGELVGVLAVAGG